MTDEQKKQIAIERQTRRLTYKELASAYGVSIGAIATALGKRGRLRS